MADKVGVGQVVEVGGKHADNGRPAQAEDQSVHRRPRHGFILRQAMFPLTAPDAFWSGTFPAAFPSETTETPWSPAPSSSQKEPAGPGLRLHRDRRSLP